MKEKRNEIMENSDLKDMNINNETLLLGKMQLQVDMYNDLDRLDKEIDEIIKSLPAKQQQNDYEISDYLHRIEDENIGDVEFLNIGKKLQKARLIRRDLNCTYLLAKAYNENKDKLFHSPASNRATFKKAISDARKYLHEDYKYRVLTDSDLENLKKDSNKQEVSKRRKAGKDFISKEMLEDCLNRGMRNKDIAEKFDVLECTITSLKKFYGLKVREYNRKK